MTDHGVSDSDMPTFTWPTWPDAETLDALLSGNCRPEEAPAELRPVAEVLVALQAPPDPREVAGWGEALSVYRDLADRPGSVGRPGISSPLGTPSRLRSRRPRRIAPPLGAKLAAAAGAAAIAVLGGGAAAAYTGSLPAALQKFAHTAIAAPSVPKSQASPVPEGTGHRPSVSDGVTYGLCHAYQQAEEHGSASQRAVAFRRLVNAAGGTSQVATYCAPIRPPGSASPPGRRVGQTAAPTDTKHGRKPTAPPGKPTTTPSHGNGNGNGHGTK
jgi:hypothetical protein